MSMKWLVEAIPNAKIEALINIINNNPRLALAEALRRAGIDKISEKSAVTILKRWGTEMGHQGAKQALGLLARAPQAASWGLAGIAGLSAGFWVTLGLGTALVLGGGYYWANHMGEKPIKPGPKQASGAGPVVQEFTKAPGSARDKFYIYAVNTSGWSLYVGRPTDVEGRAAGSFIDGGTSDTPVAYRLLSTERFDTETDAIAHLKRNIGPGHDDYWRGRYVKFGGEEFRTVHLPELN